MIKHLAFFISLLFVTTSAVASAAENPVRSGTTARFTVITAGCIRIEYSDSGMFIDDPSLFAVHRDELSHQFSLTRRADSTIVIETYKLKLTYRPNGKPFSSSNLEIIVKAVQGGTRWTPGVPNTKNLGGTNRTLDGVTDEVPIADGLLSRNGWYLHDDSRRTLFTQDWERERPRSAGTDWYFFAYGTDYKSALKDLAAISGDVPLPRKYVLGSWYSRYWPYTSDEYRQIVSEYDTHDFPLDVMVMDMDWHKDGWTGWSWNRKLLPDAEALLKWFHEKNVAVTLNLHPADGVGPHEDMYGAFMKDMGVDLAAHPDSVIPFDAANKKYMETLFRDTHDPLEQEGVDFWWLDWQQFGQTRGNPELSNLEWLNHLYYIQTGKRGERGISFSRWGGWGNHRYPINFSGDAGTKWSMLEFEVPFTTTAGNVGCFFWSHDIGGHMGGFFPETNCRWIQFGSVSAALRLHSTRDASMDKRPWIRDSMYTVSQRIAFHLRSELFPYIYTSAWRSVTEMTPLTSPMYIEYPEREIAYEMPQEYMFGPALLASPIASPGIGPGKVASQQVWFPDGVWYNWFTGERFEGSEKIVSVLADINEFPLYAKAGMPIAMQPYTPRMATTPLKELVVRTFPGAEREGHETLSRLYEDDGISQEEEHGTHAITSIVYKRTGDSHTITIRPVEGSYPGQVKDRSYRIEIPCTKRASEAFVNGVATQCEYDEHMQMNRIMTREFPVSMEVTVRIVALDADAAVARSKAESRRMAGVFGAGARTAITRRLDGAMIAALKEQVGAEALDHACAMLSGVSVKVKNDRVEILRSADAQAAAEMKVRIEDITPIDTKLVLDRELTVPAGRRLSLTLAQSGKERLGVTTARYVSYEYSVGKKKYSVREKISERASAIRQWNIVGPFAFDIRKGIAEQSYGPEHERVFDARRSYTGNLGQQIGWQQIASGADDVIDLGNTLKGTDCVAYAFVYLKSRKNQTVTFNASSDDGIEMFVNNIKVHSNNVMRGVDPSVDTVKAVLHKGINTLLVKISQGSGGWGFRINVKAADPIESSPTAFK
ncbi:MAG TPA: TIM-barrel domain-containing protein [Bacteroidota bacterium]|nr:TIM-barrel domain-containing protein [Bacteroidota bacterium]